MSDPTRLGALREEMEGCDRLLSLLDALIQMPDEQTVLGSDATEIMETVLQFLSPPTAGSGSESEAAESSGPEEILPAAMEVAKAQVTYMGEVRAYGERERAELLVRAERLRRERLLPTEDVMARVIRYEAHLSRELYKSMHELEALQARRRGQPTPLLRLDVSGLSAG